MTAGVPEFRIGSLSPAHVADLLTWRYPAPYGCYDLTGSDPEELLDPGQHYWGLFRGDDLVGFRSFGRDGQVPGWDYDDAALDTGGGLRPELTGHGWGAAAIGAGLAFGRQRYAPPAFRMTVASWNVRALRTVQRLGFEVVGHFTAPTAVAYDVLVRSATATPDESASQGGPVRPAGP